MFKVRHARTMNEQARSLWGRGAMALEYLLLRRGPMSIPPAVVGAFVRSDPAVETPDLQYFIYPFSFDKVGDRPHPFPAITASVANLRPESRGTVRIGSADPAAAPRIDPNYLSTLGDCRVAAQALRLTRRIFAAPAMKRFEPEEFKPGSRYQTDEELIEAARDIGSTIFHPVGTCKMGVDDMAVVDARLRVVGIAGLRVVDASVMPAITSGNTNAPTIMIAEKASDIIRADHRATSGASAATPIKRR
jgi:choline dehydrogenase-like flavoprotein